MHRLSEGLFLCRKRAGRGGKALVAAAEIDDLCGGGYRPREAVEQIERRDSAEVGKNSVHPHDAENAGAEDHNDRRHDALPEAARGGDGAVHKRGDGVRPAHYAKPLHPGLDDLRLICEEGEKFAPEHEQQPAEQRARREGIRKADEIAFQHAVTVPRTEVLADEAGAACVECGHDVEDDGVGVRRGGVAGDEHGVKGVDARLHEEIGDGKNGVLQAGGDAQRQHVFTRAPVKIAAREVQTAGVAAAQQMPHDEHGGKILGDDAGNSDAVRRHAADDDKKQVEDNVQHPGDGQIQQGALRLPAGAQHAVAEVIYRHGGHTEGVYFQIQHRAADKLLLRVQQGKQRLRKGDARRAQHKAGDGADDEGGMDCDGRALFAARAEPVRHAHIDAAAHADEKAREQRDQQRRRADSAQRLVIGELARHGDVAEVEKDLKKLRQHQRQTEKEYVFPQRACGHFYGMGMALRVPAHSAASCHHR